MNTDTDKLTERFTETLNRAPGAQFHLLLPLLSLLVGGEPVTVEQLAAHTGRSAEEIRQALAAMPDTEYDADGRIIGYGITINPTPHRYQVDGRTLYTWCALDTLAFPAVLGHTAHITSPCRATGEPIRLTVTPEGPRDVHPDTAVVSIVTPDAPTSVRASFCNQVHFFARADAAQDWLTEHPGAHIVQVTDAHRIAQPVIEQIRTGDTHGCS